MKDIKFFAIFVGLIVDIFGSLFSGIVISIVVAIYLAVQGMPLKQISVQLSSTEEQSFLALHAAIGIGEFSTFVGGFVTGWMAKSAQLKNALIMGILSTLLGALFWSFNPLWFNIVCIPFTPASAAVGGYLAYVFFGQRSRLSA
jgi:hypothetical protein